VQRGKFRADLYYRLNAVTIKMPALRERPDDITLLFRKFTSDFSQKYNVCKINLTPDAAALLKSYRWPGNIRQLKNVAETVSALESSRLTPTSERCEISAATLAQYIPRDECAMPSVTVQDPSSMSQSEKEALVMMIYNLKQEVDFLKNEVASKMAGAPQIPSAQHQPPVSPAIGGHPIDEDEAEWQDAELDHSDDLSIERAGIELIRKALERNGGNRKAAAAELGISERTLYRKIKEMEK